MSALETVLRAFPDAKRRNDRHFSARCKAHSDKHASVGIKMFDDGGVAVRCFAGCSRDDVLAAHGLTHADLMNGSARRDWNLPAVKGKCYPTLDSAVASAMVHIPGAVEEERFEYRRDGKAIAWNIRFNLPTAAGAKQEKTFRPIRAADGGFLVGAPDVWPLYGGDGIGDADVVTVHEGERKADVAAQCGLVAVGAGGGANGVDKTSFSALAHAKTIAIFPDNDEASEKWAKAVAMKARRENPSAAIKILRLPGLPPKGDFVEFATDLRSCQSAEDIAGEVLDLIRHADAWIRPEIADADAETRAAVEIVTADRLVSDAPELRPIIINGLLRRGEVMNLIAAPKMGKSWAVHNLALALAMGGNWFGYACMRGRTLLIDNELHRETLSSRLGKVAHSHGLITANLREWVDVLSLRGNLRNLHELGETFSAIARGTYAVVILDSLYRALPPGTDENSNVDITALYNRLDHYAAMMNAAFVVVHHTSKGTQGGKTITDVGAGAGAQARAADSHVALRPHEEDGVIVLDAVVRSFPPPNPSCWRFEVPAFHPADNLDPTALQTSRKPRRVTDESGAPAPKAEPWTPRRFAERFIVADAKTLDRLKAEAAADGLTDRKAENLTRQAVAMGYAHEWAGKTGPGGRPKRFATIPCPLVEVGQ